MITTAVPGKATEPRHDVYRALLHECKSLEPVATAVAYPCETTALAGCIEAAEAGLIAPVLVGPRQKISEVAAEAGLNVSPYTIEDVPDAHAAAAGLVLGARVPIILTSRADNVQARMASCGIALLVAHARRSGHMEAHP